LLRVGLSTLLFAGAALGLAAFFLEWTGDGRGIDYIRPASRFQSGYQLPLPLTMLADVHSSEACPRDPDPMKSSQGAGRRVSNYPAIRGFDEQIA